VITEDEIDLGVVLHLDPDELEACGAAYSCSEEARVTGGHFFLCIGADDSGGLWLPLYTNPGPGRTQLSTSGRMGHRNWTLGTFHYHLGQVWLATHHAVVRAAAAGGDMSAPGRRNRLADEQAAIVAQAIPAAVS